MKRHYIWLGVLVVAILLLSMALPGCTRAPSNPSSAPNSVTSPDSVAAPAPAPASNNAPQEGIKVHGHWTIEVRNPDGTLAEHREFENALYSWSGNNFLTSVLGRVVSVGGWEVCLAASNATDNAFADSGSNPAAGYIEESSYAGSAPNYFKNLTVSLTAGTGSLYQFWYLTLSGTATAQRNGKIGVVYTSNTYLGPTSPPASSYSGNKLTITQSVLSDVVNVSAGQQIAVTVVISFS